MGIGIRPSDSIEKSVGIELCDNICISEEEVNALPLLISPVAVLALVLFTWNKRGILKEKIYSYSQNIKNQGERRAKKRIFI